MAFCSCCGLVRPVDPAGLEIEGQERRQPEADGVVLDGPGQAPLTGQASRDAAPSPVTAAAAGVALGGSSPRPLE